VSFITCGRGRGFGLEAGVLDAGVISDMCLVLTAIQCRSSLVSWAFAKLNAIPLFVFTLTTY
jgi:hypothetical protein